MKIWVVLLGIQPREAAGTVTGSLTGIFTRPILAAKSQGDAHAAGGRQVGVALVSEKCYCTARRVIEMTALN